MKKKDLPTQENKKRKLCFHRHFLCGKSTIASFQCPLHLWRLPFIFQRQQDISALGNIAINQICLKWSLIFHYLSNLQLIPKGGILKKTASFQQLSLFSQIRTSVTFKGNLQKRSSSTDFFFQLGIDINKPRSGPKGMFS